MNYQLGWTSERLKIEVVHAKPVFGHVELLSVCLVVNRSRHFKIVACAKRKTLSSWRLEFANAKRTSMYVEERLFQRWTSEGEAEMLGTRRFSCTSVKSRSNHVWTLGLVFFFCTAPSNLQGQNWMKIKKIKCLISWNEWKNKRIRTDLSKEFLDASVGQRGNLSLHEVLYKLLHVDILNQRERRRLLGRSCGCIGRDGLPLARHRGDGHPAMGRSMINVGSNGRKSCWWTSDNSCGWICSALNGSLIVETGGHLTGDNPFTFPLTFCGTNFFDNGGRGWIIVFFRLFLQFNYLPGSGNEVVVEGSTLGKNPREQSRYQPPLTKCSDLTSTKP